MRKILGLLGKVICWFLTLFFVILMFAGGVSTILFGLAALLVIPMGKLNDLKEKLKIGKKINVGLVIVLFFVGASFMPEVENSPTIPEVPNEIAEEVIEEKSLVKEADKKSDIAIDNELPGSEAESVVEEDSTFSIRFLDVDQADAALVECDGHYMLIDGGSRKDSDKMYAILEESEIKHLDIMVGTHVDEDHIGGLAGALNYATSDIVLCTTTTYDTEVFNDFAKYAKLNGGGIVVPEIGDVYSLGSAKVTILGINAGEETNNSSIVLKIEYGEMSFLFTGDAEETAEQAIVNSGEDISATVLKVGHHGSADSTTQKFLEKIMPMYAIISVGAENTYLHPAKETLDKLERANVEVYRTDLQGEIKLTSDGKAVSITTEKNAGQEEIMTSGADAKVKAEEEARAKAEAEKQIEYTYQNVEKKMYAMQAVNVRGLPNTDGDKLGGLSYAEEVTVTGYCNETGWYRINYNGVEAYVSNQYLKDEEPVQKEVSSEKNVDSTEVTVPEGTEYILNKNTGKFHYPSCRSVKQMKEKNKVYYNGTRDEVIAKGYDSCGNCHP